MRMQVELRPRLEQRLKLAPQIIQSIEILQLPILALQERIAQEQLENPLLEVEEVEAPIREDRLDDPSQSTLSERVRPGQDYAKLDNLSEEWREYFYQPTLRTPPDEDRDEKLDAIQNAASRPMSLADYLIGQLMFLNISDRMREIAEAICHNLDRDGRLMYTLEEIGASLDEPATMAEMEEALRIVQSLDPPGIGARDLTECLLLQLDKRDPDYELYRTLIEKYLPDIEMNRFPKIAKELNRDLDEIKAAVEFIATLNAAPGRLYDNETVPYVVPDVIVELVDGRYEVSIADHNLPRLRVSQEYRQLAQSKEIDAETREFIHKKMESARWLIDAIQQRRQTLLRISRHIVEAQQDFFEHGIAALKPLKMQEIADRSGVHVATVSRAIRDKYIQTPRGVYPLKFFFTGGTRGAEGEMESWDAVKQRIKEMVEKEDRTNPLSDDEIAQKLRDAGIDIARRTVTKYRQALGIPSSRQRKEY